jgi:hypothetical protein
MIERLLPESFNFKEIKATLHVLNRQILKLERNYENEFLIASGDTFKSMDDYS